MLLTLATVAVFGAVDVVQAENWGQWRGPRFDGSSTEKNLPTEFGVDQNVAWKFPLPGPSAGTPVVWDDRVFVSSADLENETLKAYCLDRKSGQLLWERTIGQGIAHDTRSNYAAPSPATDGETVIFFYGNGQMLAFDFDGKELWSKNVGPFAFQWTFSTSPVLYDGKLYLQVLQRDTPVNGRGGKENPSYLLALEPKTGDELWRVLRPSKAQAESLEAFNTPMPYEYNGRKQILIAGGDALTGHNPETGEELWRWGTWNPQRIGHWRLVPSPIAGDGVVLACAPKKEPIFALPVDKSGLLNDDAILWDSEGERPISSDVPTPAFYDGDFFVLSDVSKSLSRVEARTGKVKWTVDTPGRAKYEASPLAGDGKIYALNFDGEAAVFDAGTGKLLQVNALDKPTQGSVRSSIIASQEQLFIRTTTMLYCIGK
ncbi:PQQ-binding-like beta-propeller repeat protein [Lignipirellula cremea]|nr:PQQ-binding-like beta-propeller repeat protein [Lignipirellula cremea]